MSSSNHRFIEDSFPVKEVGISGAKEKNIRQGHISTMHIWWARRPLGVSRATAYASLVPAAESLEEWQRQRNFIIGMCQWNSSLDPHMLEKARRDILQANKGRPPRVLDPFSGGGSYPLEAMRLGCEAYANDYNPVAVLVLKASLEYPQKFGGIVQIAKSNDLLGGILHSVNPLVDAVKHWGERLLDQVEKELASFYPHDPDGSIPVGYIWARTIPCQNPSCGAEIPLMRQTWLLKQDKAKVALHSEVRSGKLKFNVVGDGYAEWPAGFDPDIGTVARAVVTCPLCGSVIDDKTTRRLFQEGQSGQQMVAVVLYHPNRVGKTFRVAATEDISIYNSATAALEDKRAELWLKWGLDPVPDEEIPLMSGAFNVPIYGMRLWGDLFNTRQKLALITFADKVRGVHEEMISKGVEDEFAIALATYLALLVDRIADFTATLCQWENTRGNVKHVLARQALPMLWDYIEANPLSAVSGGAKEQLNSILRVLTHLSQIRDVPTAPAVTNASATQLPYPDSYFDAILTDPPYYNSVPYADLSDFFYVWLKRTVSHLHPELFSTPLSPKDREITEMAGWDSIRYAHKNKAFFEDNLKLAFQEMYRVLRPEGVAIIVYAHKSTEGWETVINALLDSGFVVTGAWPLNTEMQSRLRASESATLSSSIYIVTRKMARKATGFYNDVRDELRTHMNSKLHRLWEEGIGGADFFIAAIGSAIEIFGKYEQVLDYEGKVVRADRLLAEVSTIATDYAVRQILHNGFAGEISELARFYVLWRWNYGEARVPFDEARKLAQSVGIDLTREWGRGGFIRKEKEFMQVLGPQARKLDDLEDSHELIDVLHRVLLLWEKGQKAELMQVLTSTGYGKSEAFYRVAQAISETLPNESREKKLLDGFLTGRERLQAELINVATRPKQSGLWDEEGS